MDQQFIQATTEHQVHAPAAGPSTAPVPIARRSRRRLSELGYEILKAYRLKLPTRPNAEQRRIILKHLRTVKGCEWYTDANLVRYFQDHGKDKDKRVEAIPEAIAQVAAFTEQLSLAAFTEEPPVEARSISARTLKILFPSLNSRTDAFENLEILLEEDPYPRPEVVKIWSDRLNVNLEDVNGWIAWKRSKASSWASSRPGTRAGTAALPTPEQSTSPEPSSTRVSPQDNNLDAYLPTPTSPTFKPSVAQIPASPTVKTEHEPLSIKAASQLLSAVQGSRQHLINSDNAPTTCATFKEFHRPFDDIISRLNEKLCKQEPIGS
ncbi:hypothetical protein OBBRIDRAFT_796822 [Obba rivulosa]|uniref:Uncharacterized protein n=1 Tax=Obba rivulosa TaxID=1052685 RepID=A0A8E2ALG9_9APHY|nr:hypothetical protein OBBRIDRAFT_796822 [Obba rivulosa]